MTPDGRAGTIALVLAISAAIGFILVTAVSGRL